MYEKEAVAPAFIRVQQPLVLVKKAKYNYIIGVSGIAFFSVALLEELRMFSQWIEDGEVGMLTHALQNLPVQFTISF